MSNQQFHREKGVHGNSLMHFHTPSTAALEQLFTTITADCSTATRCTASGGLTMNSMNPIFSYS